jgi:hypothetical protein
MRAVVRRTEFFERFVQPARSIRLDTRKLRHLAPFLGFFGDQFAEIGGRAGEHGSPQTGEPYFDFGVTETRVDFLVEPIDDLCGRVLGRADTIGSPRSQARSRPRSAGPTTVRTAS